jgi:nitrite reductase/ring-hydroxylating ferredoxin subunit/DMSO/TMAO reductase YedYZ heme-binding membrane subunit
MGHPYRAVGWNLQKRRYDLILVFFFLVFVGVFAGIAAIRQDPITIETVLIRALGLAAIVLLHVVLSIGPLARLDRRFLPLLYNRRHLGVTMFLVALGHGVFSIVQFHALGDLNPILSVLVSDGSYSRGASNLPFQPLGLVALILLFLMAATSHDFWLKNLGPPTWKTLHLGVYFAYFLAVMHVALGALQVERHPLPALLLLAGSVWIAGLHLAAWQVEHRETPPPDSIQLRAPAPLPTSSDGHDSAADQGLKPSQADPRRLPAKAAEMEAIEPVLDGFVRLCHVNEIEENRAATFELEGSLVAVFRYDRKFSAVANACAHQNGPLGEGRIIDGCITCPWHGYQYRPEDGASPPPFEERIATYRLRVVDDHVWIWPHPNPPGTPEPPARIGTQTPSITTTAHAKSTTPETEAGVGGAT